MKQKIWCAWLGVVICFSAASCGIKELGKVESDQTNGVWNGPAGSESVSGQNVTYVSAFDYPDGYDWRSDPERGTVRCSLVVFREGLPILKIPVGNEYNVSPDPDMHRIIDGHLYTDFSTASETIVKKDGKPLFSYPWPEMICDFLVDNDNVHTLGHSRLGEGFTYRVNGEVVLERTSGYTFERIVLDESSVCIAFAEPIFSTEGTVERYYIMKDGKVSQVALRDDIKRVWDVAFHAGEVYYLASLTGVASPVLVSEQGMTTLPLPSSLSLVTCRMQVLSDAIWVEGILSDGNQVQSVLWDNKRQYKTFPKGKTFAAFCQGADVVHCAMNPATEDGAGLIYRSGESLDMPLGYATMGRNAMSFSSGMLSVGLSSLSDGKPILWVDGQIKKIDARGYISYVASKEL